MCKLSQPLVLCSLFEGGSQKGGVQTLRCRILLVPSHAIRMRSMCWTVRSMVSATM